MPGPHPADAAHPAWGGDAGGHSHTCGHEAVGGQQELRRDLHPYLRVRKLKQGEVMPLPLPVWDPLLFPIVSCGITEDRLRLFQNHCWFLEVFPESQGTDKSFGTK